MVRNFLDSCTANLVTGNCQILSLHDLGNSWKLTSSPNTSKFLLGPPKGSQWGGPGVPSHGIPWAPKGSTPMTGPGPPPMGSLGLPRVPTPMGPLPWDPFGLPRVPSHGVPPHPIPFRFPTLPSHSQFDDHPLFGKLKI